MMKTVVKLNLLCRGRDQGHAWCYEAVGWTCGCRDVVGERTVEGSRRARYVSGKHVEALQGFCPQKLRK